MYRHILVDHLPTVFFSIKGNGYIQGDTIYPGGEFKGFVVPVEGKPQLQNYLLYQVLLMLFVFAIGIRHFVNDAFMLFHYNQKSFRISFQRHFVQLIGDKFRRESNDTRLAIMVRRLLVLFA
jgi:hypothetical protein